MIIYLQEISQPFWVQLELDQSWKLTECFRWPLSSIEIHIQLKSLIETKIGQFHQARQINLLQVDTEEPEGTLQLFQISISQYRGIWIPSSFSTLLTMCARIFPDWTFISDLSFKDWVGSFFALRTDPLNLKLYQLHTGSSTALPPLFIRSAKIVKDTFLHTFVAIITNAGTESLHIADVMKSIFPAEYLTVTNDLPGEDSLLKLYLLEGYLETLDPRHLDDILQAYHTLQSIHSDFADVILINFARKLAQQNRDEFGRLVDHIINISKTSVYPQISFLGKKVLARYYRDINDYKNAETYLNDLLIKAPEYSWALNEDLFEVELALSKLKAARGDYPQAIVYFQFARFHLREFGTSDIIVESDKEYIQLSILSVTQKLHAGLYTINQLSVDNEAISVLIDGIKSALDLYYQQYQFHTQLFDLTIFPLISAATNLLLDHFSLIEEEVGYHIMKLPELILAMQDPAPYPSLLSSVLEMINGLQFRQQNIVEQISIFYHDGRHIRDFELRGGVMKEAILSPDQALFSSAMSAVNLIIGEATQSESPVEKIEIGDKTLSFVVGNFITITLITSGEIHILRKTVDNILPTIENTYSTVLQDWNGNMDLFDDDIPLLQLMTPLHKYMKERSS